MTGERAAPPGSWRLPLTTAVLVLAGLAALSVRDYTRLERETAAIERSEELSQTVDRLQARLVDAEAGYRGYIITGSRDFLQPYTDVEPQALRHLQRLAELADDDEARRAEVLRLSELVTGEIREMQDVIAIFDAGDGPRASAAIASGRGKRLMDAIRDVGAHMKAAEQGTLRLRAAQAAQAARSARGFAVAAGLVMLLLLGVAWSLNRLFAHRQRALDRETIAKLEAQRDAAEKSLGLEQSESFNRSILDNSGDGIAVLTSDGTVTMLNEAGLAGLELAADGAWRHRPWGEIWGAGAAEAEAAVRSAVTKGDGRFVLRRNAANGDERWWDVRLSPIREASGPVSRVVATARDVTDERRADEQRSELLALERAARSDAEHAARMKDEFVSTLSHELRTPLNAILGWVGVLRQDQSSATLARALDVIDRNSRRQSQMIDDLLDMGRILSGKLRLDVHRLDLTYVIEEALASVEPAAQAKGVRLVTILGSAAIVQGDPGRLQQVLWNLLSNAIKFTPRGGRIQTTLRKVDSQVLVQVGDTGAGIAADVLPFIFDRFRQGDPASSRRHGGLGLGLSIVKSLVELHGGSVDAASDGEHQGAVFTVRLPLALAQPRSEGALETEAAPVPSPTLLDGVRVLVVDDEEDAREVVARLLQDAGATVAAAGTVDEALGWLEHEAPPDVIVSDVGMPDRDGYDLVRSVRRMAGAAGAVPAVALTALARLEDRRRALLAGFQTHLAKPVDPAELVAAVATLTRRTGRH